MPAGSCSPIMRAPVAGDPVTALPRPAARFGGVGGRCQEERPHAGPRLLSSRAWGRTCPDRGTQDPSEAAPSCTLPGGAHHHPPPRDLVLRRGDILHLCGRDSDEARGPRTRSGEPESR